MERMERLPARPPYQLGVVSLCATLLLGLVVESLAQPPVAGAVANPASFAQSRHTPTATAPPPPTRTATPTATPTAPPSPTATPRPSPSAEPTPAPTAVLSPVRTTTPTPTAHAGAIPGEDSAGGGSRRSPEPPWQLGGLVLAGLLLLGGSLLIVPRAVRSARSARLRRSVAQQATASLVAVRIEEGEPGARPISEAETIPRLPTPQQQRREAPG